MQFDSLEFTIHVEKSVFIPSQRLVVLGFIIYSVAMSITLTPDKAQSVKEACPPVRDIAWVIGKIISSFPGVLYARSLEHDKTDALKQFHRNFDCRMQLSDDSFIKPQWWVDNIEQSSSFTYCDKPHNQCISVYVNTSTRSS